MAVNAPQAGTIREFLVSEEDTVVVGQEILRLELGGAPPEKSEAPKQESQSAQESKPEEKTESKPEPKKEESKPEPPKQESKPAPPPKKESKPAPSKEGSASLAPTPGNRDERRVSYSRRGWTGT